MKSLLITACALSLLACASDVALEEEEPEAQALQQPLAAMYDHGEVSLPSGVTYDTTNAYFTRADGPCGRNIQRMSLSPSPSPWIPLGSASCRSIGGLTSDGTSLFFSDWNSDTVRKVSSAAAGPETLIAAGSNLILHRGMAVDATRVYWADERGIVSAPKTGGAVSVLAAGLWATLLKIDASSIYYDVRADGSLRMQLRRVPLTGGASIQLHENARGHVPTTVIGNQVFFASHEPTSTSAKLVRIERLPNRAGATATALYTLDGCTNREIINLDGDARSLFWTEVTNCGSGGNSIKRIANPAVTSAVTLELSTAGPSDAMRVTPERVYWISGPATTGRHMFSAARDDAGSCRGYCGTHAASGCWCDEVCMRKGDCCADKASVCM